MNALISGVNGQDGYYLTELCKKNGIEPIGISRSGDHKGDVSDLETVSHRIKTLKPAYIFHMAANSTTKYDALFENHEAISTGTLNILHSVKKYSPEAKVFITGSGVQFQNTGQPISESTPFEAANPYAIARIQSVYAARYYRTQGIKVYVGYLFHHESPLRKQNHVSQIIAQAVKRIRDGSREKIELGDVTAQKEWTFAGDTVQGMWTLMQQQQIFEAVIGSGETFTIQQWVEQCFGIINKDWRDYIQIKNNFVPEYKCLASNPRLIKSLGWSPKITFNGLAQMMVNY
mgnify:FL=1